MILHIATRADWDAACAAGRYRPTSVDREGFIHCSTSTQVVGTADRYFRGRNDLVLLCIDEARVAGDLRYEPPAVISGSADRRAGELFPHLYGGLDCRLVASARAIPLGDDGVPDLGELAP